MYGNPGRRPGIDPYRATQVDTASPAQRLLMLYDGALRFSARAVACIEAGDVAGKGVFVGKVEAIVQELQGALDHSAAPELCGQLDALYEYAGALLTHANLESDAGAVEEVASLLRTLRDGFAEAAKEGPAAAGEPTRMAA